MKPAWISTGIHLGWRTGFPSINSSSVFIFWTAQQTSRPLAPRPVSPTASRPAVVKDTLRPAYGGWKTAHISMRCFQLSPFSDRFFPTLKEVIGLFWFFLSLFFFPGKREIKVIPSPLAWWLYKQLTWYIFFLLCLISATMHLSSCRS